MLKKLFQVRFSPATFPLVVGVLFLVCFGLFVSRLGFFWDDWVQLLSQHLYGYLSYLRYFNDRPLSGWTHIIFGPLLGEDRLKWQVFTLTLRLGCVLAAWWLFQAVWPHYRRHAILAALLFAVYPGFTQQAISVAYSQHWLQYLLFIISLALMVESQRRLKSRLPLMAAALACQLLQLSITEFFMGVELLRPLILWIVIDSPADEKQPPRSTRQKLLQVLRAWAPYLLVSLIYGIWRLFFMPMSPTDQNAPRLLNELRAQPFAALLQLGQFAVIDALNALLNVWGKVFDLHLTNASEPAVIFSWIAALLAFLGFGFYLTHLKPATDGVENMPPQVVREWIALGFVGLIIAPAPLWLADKNILWAWNQDIYHADRFTLAAMLWGSLLIVGILSGSTLRWRSRALVLSALLGILVGFQIRNTNDYRWLSESQGDFFWQMAWRAPGIQPGTALISEDILFPYQGSFSTSSAFNLLYPQPKNPERVAYWFFALKPRHENPYGAVPSASFHTTVRLYTFEGHTPDSLLLQYGAQKSTCLWLLRPQDGDYPDLSPLVKKWLPVSNLGRIERQPALPILPSAQTFGPEPAHTWCYYFEKADLARQFGDWQSAATLGDEAHAKGYRPNKPGSNTIYEWMPFVEAYAHQNRWQDAADLLVNSLDFDPAYAPFVCGRWKALLNEIPDGNGLQAASRTVREKAACLPSP